MLFEVATRQELTEEVALPHSRRAADGYLEQGAWRSPGGVLHCSRLPRVAQALGFRLGPQESQMLPECRARTEACMHLRRRSFSDVVLARQAPSLRLRHRDCRDAQASDGQAGGDAHDILGSRRRRADIPGICRLRKLGDLAAGPPRTLRRFRSVGPLPQAAPLRL
eukprot:scaffold324_cov239-Pinguiococcus_pyrenoidosus.AAC.7